MTDDELANTTFIPTFVLPVTLLFPPPPEHPVSIAITLTVMIVIISLIVVFMSFPLKHRGYAKTGGHLACL